MIVIGIDPGASGAGVVTEMKKDSAGQLKLVGVLDVFDMPMVQVSTNDLVDTARLHGILKAYEPRAIVMEWPSARPPGERGKDGHRTRSYATEWVFALRCGQTLSTAQLAAKDVCILHPASWKSMLKLTGRDKMTSYALARAIIPQESQDLLLKGRAPSHDRAEAFLLAETFRRLYNSGKPIPLA